jgi:cytochrome c biogenesis protein CcmG, thiol:disulfide interchange protein DsbE
MSNDPWMKDSRRMNPVSRLLPALALALLPMVPARAEPAAIDLAAWRGKVVYLDFWASWCAPCKQAFPFMADLSRRYRPRDLVILTVNEDRRRDAGEAFLRQVQSHLSVTWDGEGTVSRSWQVNAMPTTLLFDRKGKLRFRHEGFVSEKSGEYVHQIDDLIRER